MKKKMFIVAAVIFSSRLLAQQDTSKVLDPVIVTANKIPQKQSSTGKVLIVIGREQLEKNTGRLLTQVLNEQAGLLINGAQSAFGTNQTVYMRGANAANTLILVDGVPVNDAAGISNEFDLNYFSIDLIERVEVLKGSQSVMYGSGATAGVINIITRKTLDNKKISFIGTTSFGSYHTFKSSLGVSGNIKKFNYNVAYNKLSSEGFSSALDTLGNHQFDNEPYDQDILLLNTSFQASKNWQLRFYSQYAKYDAKLDDASFTDDKNSGVTNKNFQSTLSSVVKFSKGTFNVNANYNHVDRILNDERNVPEDLNDYDPYNAHYKGDQYFLEAYTNLNLKKHFSVLLGADIRSQQADIQSTYGNYGADSLHATQSNLFASIFLQSLKGFQMELGGRYTNQNQFGNAFTYSFNPSYLLHKKIKFFANLSTAFRAPSLYNIASEYGNRALKPERSNSFEVGVQYFSSSKMANVRVVYFSRKIKDIIVFNSLPNPPYGQFGNANQQNDNGIELEGNFAPFEKCNATLNYTYLNGSISGISYPNGKVNNLFRRPKHTINTSLSYAISKKWKSVIGFRWLDKRTDLYFNNQTFENEIKELRGYYNLDLHVSYQADKVFRFFVDLQNLTNQTYFDVYGYNNRKFNFMAGVAMKF